MLKINYVLLLAPFIVPDRFAVFDKNSALVKQFSFETS